MNTYVVGENAIITCGGNGDGRYGGTGIKLSVASMD